jgi:hypothetical protein
VSHSHKVNSVFSFVPSLATRAKRAHWNEPIMNSGLPQGSPLSPHFSMWTLSKFKEFMDKRFPHVGWVCYVDDIIFWSNSDKAMEEFQYQFNAWSRLEVGIILSPEKSQVTKSRGSWLVKEFKYLGKIYNVETGQLRSSTRSGRTLNYTFQQLVDLGVLLELNEQETTMIGKVSKSVLEKAEQSGGESHLILYVYLLNLVLNKWDSNKAELFFLRKLLRMDSSLKRNLKRFTELNSSAIEGGLHWATPQEWEETAGPLLASLKGPLDTHLKALLARIRTLPKESQGPFKGPFGGLVQSRLYQGSTSVAMSTSSGSQDFVMRAEPGSLGHILMSKAPGLTIFNGSSYACHEMVRLAKGLNAGRKVRLLPNGAMPFDSSQLFKGRSLLKSTSKGLRPISES